MARGHRELGAEQQSAPLLCRSLYYHERSIMLAQQLDGADLRYMHKQISGGSQALLVCFFAQFKKTRS